MLNSNTLRKIVSLFNKFLIYLTNNFDSILIKI